jgi:hypothetical protein
VKQAISNVTNIALLTKRPLCAYSRHSDKVKSILCLRIPLTAQVNNNKHLYLMRQFIVDETT